MTALLTGEGRVEPDPDRTFDRQDPAGQAEPQGVDLSPTPEEASMYALKHRLIIRVQIQCG